MHPKNFILEVARPGPMNIKELVVCYLRAVERFRAHAVAYTNGGDQQDNESRARGALAEALNWADSVDQYLGQGPKDTMGSDRDPDWAAKVDGAGGDLVRAFQYARNHVHHQWLNLVGTRIYSGAQSAPDEWYWTDIPQSTRAGSRKRAGAEEYEQKMLGADVLTTLDRLGEVFWAKRTWVIHRSEIAQPWYEVGAEIDFDPEPKETKQRLVAGRSGCDLGGLMHGLHLGTPRLVAREGGRAGRPANWEAHRRRTRTRCGRPQLHQMHCLTRLDRASLWQPGPMSASRTLPTSTVACSPPMTPTRRAPWRDGSRRLVHPLSAALRV